jgi:hypothetical protein
MESITLKETADGSSLAILEVNWGYDERTPDVVSIVRPST